MLPHRSLIQMHNWADKAHLFKFVKDSVRQTKHSIPTAAQRSPFYNPEGFFFVPLLCFFFLAASCILWNLSSWTRDLSQALGSESAMS